ncbi:conserved hypothetical protein [Coccidioides posadasii str. Silveira]|uniref:Uncharacterized protein n=1 Tax=Coccidioides posadasii (strain RMSCC 757 / Silveira) TaxID=443226 RepID=E9DDD0_COCPS|nr:conserved hypothetical protein [Coccidioides posadasii str. Silveira]
MALYSKPRAENDAPSPKQGKQGTRCQDRQNRSGTSQPQATSHTTLAMRDSLKLPMGCLETENMRGIFRLSRMEFYKTPLPAVVEISCYLYWVLEVVVRAKI